MFQQKIDLDDDLGLEKVILRITFLFLCLVCLYSCFILCQSRFPLKKNQLHSVSVHALIASFVTMLITRIQLHNLL